MRRSSSAGDFFTSLAQIEIPFTAEPGQDLFGLQEIGGMGIYAQVKDSEDNIIGLWQPLSPG